MNKRDVAAVLIVLLVVLAASSAASAQPPPGISAQSAVLLDWNTSRILYERNASLPLHMASTTKIMTAILALEKGDMEESVVTSSRAAATGGSSIWLESGEVKTLEELLYGLMLRSGNDAAVAIAEHISGSVESFAAEMTLRARELRALDTSFRNPHGLHHPDHYTTAHDLAVIAAHAMGIKKFSDIIATQRAVISWPGHPWDRHLFNQNRLLQSYRGAEGIKTGWTTPAGRCFVGSAQRGGRRLIVVFLNAPQMWEDTSLLLDYGYDDYTYRRLVGEGQYLKSVPVVDGVGGKVKAVAAANFNYPLGEDETKKVTYRFLIDERLYAPLRAGERIGELEIYFDRQAVGVVDLMAGDDVRKISFWERLKRKLGRAR